MRSVHVWLIRQCVTRKFTLLRVTGNSRLPDFRTSGIPTVGNSISENPELRGNLTEILTEMLNGNKCLTEMLNRNSTKIPLLTELLEINLKFWTVKVNN